MLAHLASFVLCYLLGVASWYILRLYFLKSGVPINNYYAFIASLFSTIIITIILRLTAFESDGCVISGVIVMALFSLDKNQEPNPKHRWKALLFMLVGSICAGLISALLSQIPWFN